MKEPTYEIDDWKVATLLAMEKLIVVLPGVNNKIDEKIIIDNTNQNEVIPDSFPDANLPYNFAMFLVTT